MARHEEFFITVITVLVCLEQGTKADGNIPKPQIIQTPAASTIYRNEHIKLDCRVEGDKTDLQFFWYKGDVPLVNSNNIYVIDSAATSSHNGEYRCQVQRGNDTSDRSDPQPISVLDLPQTKLELQSKWTEVFPSEVVNMRCNIQPLYLDWICKYYRDNNELNSGDCNMLYIQSAALKDSGVYTCVGVHQSRNLKTQPSNSINISVSDLPQTKLELQSKWTKVFLSEVVNMKCDIQPSSPDWSCKYYREDNELSSKDCSMLSIQSTTDDSGVYTCVGVHRSRPLKTQPSNSFKVYVYANHQKPSMSMDPSHPPIYTPEKVNLSCQLQWEPEGWTYLWYYGQDKKLITSTGRENHHILSSVKPASSGQYWCQVERDGFKSEHSDSLQLEIKDLPQTKLELQSKWTKVFPSEVVNMTCDIQPPSPDWICKYYRDNDELNSGDCNMLSIQSATREDSGVYTCVGVHQSRNLKTQPSNSVNISVNANRPKPLLSVDPNDPPLYTPEKISLSCQVQTAQDGWTYLWYYGQDKKLITSTGSESHHILSSVTPGSSGQYWCQVERDGFKSEHSGPLQLEIKALPQTKLELHSKWTKVFPSEVVNMTCDIQPPSLDWICKYYRDNNELNSGDCNMLSIQSVTLRDSGVYTCVGVHQSRTLKTQPSNNIKVHVYDHSPKPSVSVDPSDPPIYSTEKVNLSCQVQKEQKGWTYLWYEGRDPNTPIFQASERTYTISSAEQSHTGNYSCQVKRESFTSEYSDPRMLTIQDPPRPDLQLSKWDKVFPSETVSMKCKIIPASSDWTYKWYKDQQELINENADTLSMSSVTTKQSGLYTCQGVHNRQLKTIVSNMISIHVYDNKAVPTLSQYPNYTSLYMEEQVTFMCDVEIDSTGWQYQWFKKNLQGPIPDTDPTVTNYTIQSASLKDDDEFWCTVQRGAYQSERSRTIKIKILSRPHTSLTLETGWTDILTVDSLTLLCKVHGQNTDWNYTWYNNSVKMPDNSHELHVKATRENYRNEFRCQGVRTNRPTYSMRSEAFIANNIVLKRQIFLGILGCLVVGIILIILGCVYTRFTKKPEKERKPEPDLFFSMAELKSRSTALGSTTDLRPAETVDKPETIEKNGFEDPTCLSEELLKEAKESQNEGEGDGFKSFKGL